LSFSNFQKTAVFYCFQKIYVKKSKVYFFEKKAWWGFWRFLKKGKNDLISS